MLITMSGSVGEGKTTLTKYLSQFLHTKPFYEKVAGNPILPLFYKGNKLVAEGKWKHNVYCFLLQIYFLNYRFREIKEAQKQNNNVLDRSIYEDKLFEQMNYELGNATKEEWQVYKSLLSNMLQELPLAAHTKRPDLMVYLYSSLSTQLKHIKKRNRPYEQISNNPNLLGYYKNLKKYYEQWYKSYHYSPKMKINLDKYDFVNNKQDRMKVLRMIEDKLISIGKLSAYSINRDHLD